MKNELPGQHPQIRSEQDIADMIQRQQQDPLSTLPFGFQAVDGLIPSEDDIKHGRHWREYVAKATTTPLLPSEQLAILQASVAIRRMAIEALRQTVLQGRGSHLQLSKPDGWLEAPHAMLPSAQEMKDYGGVTPLEHATDDDLKNYDGHDKGTLQAKLRALHTDARAEMDENIVTLRELVVDYCDLIRTDRQAACQSLEEMIAVLGRSIALMRRQFPEGLDVKQDAAKILVDGVREMFEEETKRTLRDLPSDADRRHFAAESRGTLELFLTGRTANRSPA